VNWYVASIADRAVLEVLLQQIREAIDHCRAEGRLPSDAEAFVVGAGTVVHLYLNEPARRCLHAVAGLALMPAPAPPDRGRSLLD
jgi:hypothetical protein